MRKEFEMSESQLAAIIEASKAVPAIMLQCGPVPSVQENANRAWKALGDDMGFEPMSVRPSGKGNRFFTAEALPEGKTVTTTGKSK